MKVEIISISTDLLMGDILDVNTSYVSRSLRQINAKLTYKTFVGNELDAIIDVFQIALRRSDVVLAIGGLGDGPQEFTRLAAARATGRALIPQTPGIEGAQPIGGSDSRLKGFLIENEQGALICLPGERRGMSYLLETEVLPYLRRWISVDAQPGWVVLRTVGVMESSLKQKLSGLAQDARHRVTYDSFAGQTNVQLWVHADSQAEIERELAEMKGYVLAQLGDHVYGEGDDHLEDVVLRSLIDGGLTMALAECYTERILSRMLMRLPGANNSVQVFSTNTWRELHEIVQLEDLTPEADLTRWCRGAAELLRLQFETDLALLVYKNVTQGGVQLLVTLASPRGVSVTQRSFGGHPENIDQWAATLGLSHLRRWLMAHQ